jgi:hypothetical protein
MLAVSNPVYRARTDVWCEDGQAVLSLRGSHFVLILSYRPAKSRWQPNLTDEAPALAEWPIDEQTFAGNV